MKELILTGKKFVLKAGADPYSIEIILLGRKLFNHPRAEMVRQVRTSGPSPRQGKGYDGTDNMKEVKASYGLAEATASF